MPSNKPNTLLNLLRTALIVILTVSHGWAQQKRVGTDPESLAHEGLRTAREFFASRAELLDKTLTALSTKERAERPIPMGISISTTPTLPFISAGTTGLLVRGLANPV